MTNAEFQFVVNTLTGDMIAYLMEDRGITMQEAFDIVYPSDTYRSLQSKSTGMYRKSAAYSYEYLKRELANKELVLEK